MNKPTFYEQLGVVIPGALLLFGLVFFLPALKALVGDDGISVGDLGIFVLLAYAAGQLVAAVGNLIERIYWGLLGGMPTFWITKSTPNILSSEQVRQLEKQLKRRLQIGDSSLDGMEEQEWFPISRQIYAEVMTHGNVSRVDAFNGTYGLNRGLSAAALLLAAVSVFFASNIPLALALLSLSAVYMYRAHRFAVHYARELLLQFLVLRDVAKAK